MACPVQSAATAILAISACTGNEIMIKGGRVFAWLIVGATMCDLIENIALSQTIRGHISQWNVSIAYDLARVELSIVIVCLLFMLACSLLLGDRKAVPEWLSQYDFR